MALRKTAEYLFLVALLFVLNAVHAADFHIKVHKDRTFVKFAEKWSFDKVYVPAVSEKFWGNRLTHPVATLRIGDKPFVSSIASDSNHLRFNLSGIIASEIELIPLLTSDHEFIMEKDFLFTAVPAKVREIEQKINDCLDQEIIFIRKNNCFSCHTALPLAMACKTAAAHGFQPDQQKIKELGLAIISTQMPNGSFFYPAHPDYGIITTTLAAGAILSFLSDFCDDFVHNLQNIFSLLPNWLDSNGLIQSDFYFKPVFIGQITSTLFESIIVNTLYCKTAQIPQENHELMRQRLIRLVESAAKETDEPLHRQIITMIGMPFLYHVKSTEKQSLIEQLQHLINNEPEGKRPEIQAITAMIIKRLATADSFSINPASSGQAARNWRLFLELLQLFPVKANNTEHSADRSADD